MATCVLKRELDLFATTEVTDVTCKGASNGSAIVTVSGGTPPYTYLWSNSFTTKDLIGVPADDYVLTITDDEGLIFQQLVPIREPALDLGVNFTVTQPTCDDPNARVDVQAFGGNGAYEYSLTETASVTQWVALEFSFDNVAAASRNFLLPADIDCPTSPEQLSQLPDDVKVFDLNTNFYDITNIPPPQAPSNRLAKLFDPTPASGFSSIFSIYPTTPDTSPVWFEDLGGFSGRLWFDVPAYETLGFDVCREYKLCSVQENGNGSVWTSAQSTSITFSQQPNTQCFQESKVFDNLSPSTTYYLIVRDRKNCQTIPQPITINAQPLDITITTTVTDVLCNGDSSGEILVNATGGTTPYAYSVDGSNFQSSNLFENLLAGNYTVTVRDADGCIRTTDVVVDEPEAIELVGLASEFGNTGLLSLPVRCPQNNIATGSINVEATGGVAPYTYTLDIPPEYDGYGYGYGYQGGEVSTPQPVGSWGGLPTGDYTVLVEDVNGCIREFTVNVGQLPNIRVSYSIQTIEKNILPSELYIRKRLVIQNVTGGQPNVTDPNDSTSVDTQNPYRVRILNSSLSELYDSNSTTVYDSAPVVRPTRPYPIFVGDIDATNPFQTQFFVYYEFPIDSITLEQIGSEQLFVEVTDYYGCVVVTEIVI